jgi:flavodoxin I
MSTQIIYWPKGGSVEKVANKLESKLENVNTSAIEELDYSKLASSELIILGGSTVGSDHWTNSTYKDIWTAFFNSVKKQKIDLKGKKVALFGLGDQILYPANFVDSMKELAAMAEEQGASLVGATKNSGYTFEASQALKGDEFIGLPLDEDTEPELTDGRLDTWLAKLKA